MAAQQAGSRQREARTDSRKGSIRRLAFGFQPCAFYHQPGRSKGRKAKSFSDVTMRFNVEGETILQILDRASIGQDLRLIQC